MKISGLTSLRFIAAAMIVIHHSRGMLWLGPDTLGHIPWDHAVSFFFVLSGFVLAYRHPRIDNAYRFYLSRLERVWPLHFCAFLLLALMWWPYSLEVMKKTPFVTIANLLLVQGWIPLKEVHFSWNGLSWAVSVEVFFYLLFPWLVRDFDRTWRYKLGGSLLLVVTIIVLCNRLSLPADLLLGIIYINPLSRLFEFVLGMATALLWREYGEKVRSSVNASLLEAGVLSGAIASIYYCPLLVVFFSPLIGPAGWEYLARSSSALPFAALIFVMANQGGALSRLLQFKPLVILGEASYAMFIFHQIFLVGLKGKKAMFSLPEPYLYAIFWVFLILFSVGAYVIERYATKAVRSFRFR